MPGRSFVGANGYRYGFNGMEKEDEIKGNGNSYTTSDRQYDPRLGRWMSKDPVGGKFPWQSPYTGNDNKPIIRSDENGDCPTCITGAIIGAFTELVIQVGDQMLQGRDFTSALKSVDKSDILASAISGSVTGMLTGGADKLAKLFSDPKYQKVAAIVLETAGDYIAELIQSAGKDIFNDDFEFSANYFKDLLGDAGVSTIAGKTPITGGLDVKVVTKDMIKNAEKILVKEEKKLAKAIIRDAPTDKAAKKVLEAKKNIAQHHVADKIQQTVAKIKEESLEEAADKIKDNATVQSAPRCINLIPVPKAKGYATDSNGNLYHKAAGSNIYKKVEKKAS